MSRKLSPLYTLYKEPFKQRYISTRQLNKRLASNEQRPRVRGVKLRGVVSLGGKGGRKAWSQAVFQVLPMSIDQRVKGRKKGEEGRKDLESLAIAFNFRRIGKKQFRKGRIFPISPFTTLSRSCGVYGVIRRLFWDFVPFFESSLEFSFEMWLNLWFWEGRGEKDWEGFFLDRV